MGGGVLGKGRKGELMRGGDEGMLVVVVVVVVHGWY